jgi:hypothetical protein
MSVAHVIHINLKGRVNTLGPLKAAVTPAKMTTVP